MLFVFFRQPVRIKYAVFIGGLVFIQGLGEVDGGGFAARCGNGTAAGIAAVHIGQRSAEDGVAEQLGGLVGIAAVVAEGVADGGRGIGCQGVGGYLKPALAACWYCCD